MGSFSVTSGKVQAANATVGEPTYSADQGQIAIDQNGTIYRQMAPGVANDWRPIDVRHKPVQKHWISTGIYPVTTGTVNPPAVADPGADWWTRFSIFDPMEIYGIGIPLTAYTSGSFSLKAAIYELQPTSAYGSLPYRCLKDVKGNYCRFEISAFTPTGISIVFIPLKDPANTDPYIVEPGDYMMNHVWGSQPSCTIATRGFQDFTADNMNRSDRTRASGVAYAARDFTADRYYGLIGSGASGTTSMANINFCIFGKKI